MKLLLVTALALGGLFSILGPRIISCSNSPERRAAIETHSDLSYLAWSLDRYHTDTGQYPTTQQGFDPLLERPDDIDLSTWKGPYLETEEGLSDPWGNAYRYSAFNPNSRLSFSIWSTGPDGLDWTEDDIKNWR